MITIKPIAILSVCIVAIAQTGTESSRGVPASKTVVQLQTQYEQQEAEISELLTEPKGVKTAAAKKRLRLAVERSHTLKMEVQRARIVWARKGLDAAETRLQQRVKDSELIVSGRVERLIASPRVRSEPVKPRDLQTASSRSADEVKYIITKAITDLEKDLKQREADYEEFQKRTQLLLSGGQVVDPNAQRISAFGSALTTLDLEKRNVNAELTMIEKCVKDLALSVQKGDDAETADRLAEIDRFLVEMFSYTPAKEKLTVGAVRQKLKLQAKVRERLLDTYDVRQESLRRDMMQAAAQSRALRGDLARNENFKAEIERKRETHRELVQRLRDVELMRYAVPR